MSLPVVDRGRIWCHDEHQYPSVGGLPSKYWRDRGPEAFDAFGTWLFHRLLIHTDHDWLKPLARLGFIDTIPYGTPPAHDGGTAFWRWDFWRSGFAKEWREQAAKQQEMTERQRG